MKKAPDGRFFHAASRSGPARSCRQPVANAFGKRVHRLGCGRPFDEQKSCSARAFLPVPASADCAVHRLSGAFIRSLCNRTEQRKQRVERLLSAPLHLLRRHADAVAQYVVAVLLRIYTESEQQFAALARVSFDPCRVRRSVPSFFFEFNLTIQIFDSSPSP